MGRGKSMSRVFLHRLPLKMHRVLDNVLSGGLLNTMTVKFWYCAVQSGTGFDPNVESSYVSEELQSMDLPTLVHFFGAKTAEITGGAVEVGDAVLVFRDDVALDGKDFQQFEINGKLYVQKAAGKRLVEEWDVMVGGNPFARTIFVTNKK